MNQSRDGLSTFETEWSQCPSGHILQPIRAVRFDPTTGLVHSPASYRYRTVGAPAELPTTDWVREAFLAFVRGEFGEGERQIPVYPGDPTIGTKRLRTSDAPYEYARTCERELIYGAYFDHFATALTGDVVDDIYSILTDPLIGNKDNKKTINSAWLRTFVSPALESRSRLRFVMPAFPFKDQNPFRTEAPASMVDLGEIALLVRLHVLVLALYQVHPYGADWILITDGNAYADIFGIDPNVVEEYQRQLRFWRNVLNLQGTVSIIDLLDLVDRFNSAMGVDGRSDHFTRTREAIRRNLTNLETDDSDCAEKLSVLRRGMAKNLNLRPYLSRVSSAELWAVLRGYSGGRTSSPGLQGEVAERAHEAALQYASFNVALRYHDVIRTFLPLALRSTIHAKPGQVAVPSLGTVFPWNGVPIVDQLIPSARGIRVSPLTDAVQRWGPIERVVVAGDDGPLFYIRS